jgi:hypothetical protein
MLRQNTINAHQNYDFIIRLSREKIELEILIITQKDNLKTLCMAVKA